MPDNAPSLSTGNHKHHQQQSNVPEWLKPNYGKKKSPTRQNPNRLIYDPTLHNLPKALGNAGLSGILDLFKDDPNIAGAAEAASIRGGKPFTANQAMFLFKHTTPAIRANIQMMMYRAGGLYKNSYAPFPGAPLTQQDINAFRGFIIGVASNPAQGSAAELLSQAAEAGDAMGTNAGRQHTPLVMKITDPRDVEYAANQLSQQMHGTYLNPDQMKVLQASYSMMEQAYQKQSYEATGYNPLTGQQDQGFTPGEQAGAVPTVTQPADIKTLADKMIREDNPNQFKANTFTDRMHEILAAIHGSNSINSAEPGGLT